MGGVGSGSGSGKGICGGLEKQLDPDKFFGFEGNLEPPFVAPRGEVGNFRGNLIGGTVFLTGG